MAFNGDVKILSSDGKEVLDIVEAHLSDEPADGHRWSGRVSISRGGALEGKRMPVVIEAPDMFSAPAILGAVLDQSDSVVSVAVLGNGPVPF